MFLFLFLRLDVFVGCRCMVIQCVCELVRILIKPIGILLYMSSLRSAYWNVASLWVFAGATRGHTGGLGARACFVRAFAVRSHPIAPARITMEARRRPDDNRFQWIMWIESAKWARHRSRWGGAMGLGVMWRRALFETIEWKIAIYYHRRRSLFYKHYPLVVAIEGVVGVADIDWQHNLVFVLLACFPAC